MKTVKNKNVMKRKIEARKEERITATRNNNAKKNQR